MANDATKNAKSNEKIINEFQTLRHEQRHLVSNISTLEMDLKEHRYIVVEYSISI